MTEIQLIGYIESVFVSAILFIWGPIRNKQNNLFIIFVILQKNIYHIRNYYVYHAVSPLIYSQNNVVQVLFW